MRIEAHNGDTIDIERISYLGVMVNWERIPIGPGHEQLVPDGWCVHANANRGRPLTLIRRLPDEETAQRALAKIKALLDDGVSIVKHRDYSPQEG